MKERTDYYIAVRTAVERERINIDLAASGVAYKERMNMPGLAFEAERQLPEHHRSYFQKRLDYYRKQSSKYPSGSDPVYAKSESEK